MRKVETREDVRRVCKGDGASLANLREGVKGSVKQVPNSIIKR